jgi:SAM-dependent methyltransferase
MSPELRHACGGAVVVEDAAARCAGCGAAVVVDDVGIVRLTTESRAWSGVPRRVGQDTLAARSAEQIVDAMVDGERPWPEELQRRLLHPAGGAPATLVDLPPGRPVLDLGTGWETLPSALHALGAEVVSADWSYERLRFARLMYEPAPPLSVQLTADGRLPWDDGSFDAVFVDVAEVQRTLADTSGAAEAVLAEVRRILTADGVAVVGVSSVPPREALSTRRWRAALAAPWKHPAVAAAGLVAARVVVPSPARIGWRQLVGLEGLAAHVRTSPRSSRPKAWLARSLAAVRGSHLLTRDAFVLAQRPDATTPPSPITEHLVGEGTAVLALSDARVAVVGTEHFAKLPLSPSQAEAVVAEVDKTHLARGTSLGAYAVAPARVEHHGPIPFSVYPLVPRAEPSLDEVEAVLVEALTPPAEHEVGPLLDTDFWRRLASSRAAADAEEIGAVALRTAVLERLGARSVPVGPTHGDLHVDNVLVALDGRRLLVDWNRFELRNPLLLDAVYAAVRVHEQRAGVSFPRALQDFAIVGVGGPLGGRAATLLGELEPADAAVVLLLDRIVSYSQPRRRYKPWTMGPFAEAARSLSEVWAVG